MKKIILGNTGIEVTELCFGALPMGPLQKNMPPEESAKVVAEALKLGVNFIDTAQGYRTYEPIRIAVQKTGIRPVIATKSPARTYNDMESAIFEAQEKMGIEMIDIFLLHAARAGENAFDEFDGALECLLKYKEKKIIRAVGISSHVVQTVRKAADKPEIDVVFPILNKTGMGVIGGTREDMEREIQKCVSNGKGVYLMKVLAGGNLIDDYIGAMEYVRNFSSGKMPVAVGMVSEEEVRMNVKYFNGEDVKEQAGKIKSGKKFFIMPFCERCGECSKACHSDAIKREGDSVPVIDGNLCLLCGYCVAACPHFAVRMI